MDEIRRLMEKKEFPRSARYESSWIIENQMGPNALWLMEWLCEKLPLREGMRVLDLGCGRAMTSVFLAREFRLRVWAADLWMDPDNNWKRVVEAGEQDRICPMRCEAHSMPFSAGFFDAAVSVDAYQYFGTDELYIDYLGRFVRPGGHIGVVVPGLTRAFDSGIPEHLTKPQANGKPFWEDACRSFKTAAFWSELWKRSSMLTAVEVDTFADGWRHWRDFERAVELSGKGIFPSDVEALERDRGEYIGFHRLIAERTDVLEENIYDPSLGARAGAEG